MNSVAVTSLVYAAIRYFAYSLETEKAEQLELNAMLEMSSTELANVLVLLKEQNQALVEASEHKSRFLAHMSHELRTPLNAIIGYSEMLQEDAEDVGATSLVEDLRKIHISGKHLLGLINNVLDLAKIEAVAWSWPRSGVLSSRSSTKWLQSPSRSRPNMAIG